MVPFGVENRYRQAQCVELRALKRRTPMDRCRQSTKKMKFWAEKAHKRRFTFFDVQRQASRRTTQLFEDRGNDA